MTINDRIKFLIKALEISARAFSHALEVSESTTRNYLDKGSKPSADYIERIATHFSQVNLVWLITGKGEPFLSDSPTPVNESNAAHATSKNFSHSQVISGKAGKASQHINAAGTESLQREVELLKAQLADKERTIQILLSHQPKL